MNQLRLSAVEITPEGREAIMRMGDSARDAVAAILRAGDVLGKTEWQPTAARTEEDTA